MDFELSEEQLALQDAAASLLEGRCPISRVRDVSSSATHLDEELWSAMAEQGWLAVELPADGGGLGLSTVEVVVLCEQLGRQLAPVPYTGTVTAAKALSSAVERGDVEASAPLGERAVRDWTERLASGESKGAVAWSRSKSSVTASAAADDFGGQDERWTLSGRSDVVPYASCADVVLVVAGTDAGPALFAMAQRERSRPAPEPAMDITRSVSRLELDRVSALRLGDEGAVADLLDRAATATSAEMLGAAARVLEMTVEYAKDRVQFGRPIGSFQAIKHRCADMLVDLEGMRSAVYYAGWAVGASDPESASAASVAKVWCSDAAARLMDSALQVHGGIGFTWEHDLHLYVKRSQLDQVSFGDAPYHRERLAGILRPKAEAGAPIL